MTTHAPKSRTVAGSTPTIKRRGARSETTVAPPVIDDVRYDIVELEALVNAAATAADGLPFIADPDARRAIARLHALVAMAAQAAAALLVGIDR